MPQLAGLPRRPWIAGQLGRLTLSSMFVKSQSESAYSGRSSVLKSDDHITGMRIVSRETHRSAGPTSPKNKPGTVRTRILTEAEASCLRVKAPRGASDHESVPAPDEVYDHRRGDTNRNQWPGDVLPAGTPLFMSPPHSWERFSYHVIQRRKTAQRKSEAKAPHRSQRKMS